MFDALAKLPTGLSQGNINWMGSIDTCRDVPSPQTPPFDNLPIKGKYCRADIGFPLEQFFVNSFCFYSILKTNLFNSKFTFSGRYSIRRLVWSIIGHVRLSHVRYPSSQINRIKL